MNFMQCDKVQDLFSEMHEGALAPGLQQVVEAHLNDCYDCRADYEGFVSLYSALGDLPEVTAPEGLSEEISRRLDREVWEERQLRPAFRGWLRLGFGAAVAAALIATVYFASAPVRSSGIEAGTGISLRGPEPHIIMRDGLPVLVIDPGQARTVEIIENSLTVTTETVPAGRKAEFPLHRKGDRAASVWIRVQDAQPMVVILPSANGAGTAGPFEGTLRRGLEVLSESFGYVIVAKINDSPTILQKDFSGLDLAASLELLLNGTGYTSRSVNGLIEVR